jgi:hypothetical protein
MCINFGSWIRIRIEVESWIAIRIKKKLGCIPLFMFCYFSFPDLDIILSAFNLNLKPTLLNVLKYCFGMIIGLPYPFRREDLDRICPMTAFRFIFSTLP